MKKVEFTVSKQNNVDVVRYELNAADVYDERVTDKISQASGIVPFQYSDEDGKRSVTSYVKSGNSLELMTKKILDKKAVLAIISGIATAFEVGALGVPVSYIVKNMNYIYVDEISYSVKCLLLPIKQDVMPMAELPKIFREILSKFRYDEQDKDNYVAKLLSLVNSDDFTVAKLKELSDHELEKIGYFVSKENGLTSMNAGNAPTTGNSVKVNKLGVMNNMMGQPPMMGGRPPMPGTPQAMMGQPGAPAPQGMPGQPPMMGGQPPMGQLMPGGPRLGAPMGQGVPGAPAPQGMPGQPPMMGGQPPMGQPMSGGPRPGAPMPGAPASQSMPGQPPMMGGQPPMGQPMLGGPRPGAPMGQGVPGAPAPQSMPGQPPMMGGQPPMGQPMPGGPRPGAPMGQPIPGAPAPQSMPGQPPMMGQPMPGGPRPGAPALQGQPMPGAPALQGQPMPGAPVSEVKEVKEEKNEEDVDSPFQEIKPEESKVEDAKTEDVKTDTPEAKEAEVKEAKSDESKAEDKVEDKIEEEDSPFQEIEAPKSVTPAQTPVAPILAGPAPMGMPAPGMPMPAAPITPSPAPVQDMKPGEFTMGNLVGQLGSKPVPHIVRKNTGEAINITKSEFTIGKSKTKADYAIENNAAISRVHCTIIQRDGVNYIKDNDSTNHTYVNGVELEPGKEVLLKNKTVIQLGDEEFTFLLRKGE